ncbi:hypothetical protein CR513_14947, partial [Mucuna pruriens]
MFQEFEENVEETTIYMGISYVVGVHCKGKILFKLTFAKTLALHNVLYVFEMRRNLVLGVLLNKVGLKVVLEFDKFVITRNRNFVGKGYLSSCLFVLNTIELNSNASNLISNGLVCIEAKHTKPPFKPVTVKETELLELVHFDLVDFKNPTSRGGKKNIISPL